jgi:transposase
VETHRTVFLWVLGMLAEEGLLKGNTVAIDGTTLEANAADWRQLEFPIDDN